MYKYLNLSILMYLLISYIISTASYAGSVIGCEKVGNVCTLTKYHNIIDSYTIDNNGHHSEVVAKYKVEQIIMFEDGVQIGGNVKNIDVKEIKIDVTLNNCTYVGSCGIREFETYLSSQGANGSLMFQALFAGSADRAAKTAFDKYVSGAFGVSIADIYDVLKGLVTNMSRPVYVRFLSNSGKVLGWIKLGTAINGTLVIAEELLYGSDDKGDFIHGSPDVFSRDDWFRDYTYVYHRVKECFTQIITITDANGGMDQAERYVCYFTSYIEYIHS